METEYLVRGKYIFKNFSEGASSIIKDGAVYTKGNIIKEVGNYKTLKQKHNNVKVIGNGKQLVMPGLIDAHTHGAGLSYVQRGVSFDFLENSLLDFEGVLNLEPEMDTMLNAIRHIRNGCTTIHHNNWNNPLDPEELDISEKKIKGYEKTGIRLAYSPGIRVKNIIAYDDIEFVKGLPKELKEYAAKFINFDKEEAINQYFEVFDTLFEKYDKQRTKIILGPSWVQGSTEEFLIKIKEKADKLGKIPIHIHTLQTPVQKMYGIRKYGKSLIEYLEDLNILDSNLVLGHAVFLNEYDIELLSKYKVSITHHPSCNLAVRNGISPVYFLHGKGVNVALGIDEKGINDDEDPIMELRMIYYLHRVAGFDFFNTPVISPYDVLKMGTVNAAKVCGFEDEIGVLEENYKADIIVVDLEEIMNDPWVHPACDLVELFIHRAKGSHVKTVLIDGKIVMEDREIKTVDVDYLYKEISKQAFRKAEIKETYDSIMLNKIKPYYKQWYNEWIKDIKLDSYYNLNSKI